MLTKTKRPGRSIVAIAVSLALAACQSAPRPDAGPTPAALPGISAPPLDTPSPMPTFDYVGDRGCAKALPPVPVTAAGPVSPVKASIELATDQGVSSPIHFGLFRYPATFRVTFDAPVDPSTFRLEVLEYDSCGYGQSAASQSTVWRSDREAEITLRMPLRLSYHAVSFGRGRDTTGREVQEPQFQFIPGPHTPTIRIGQFDVSSAAVTWSRVIHEELSPVSISPDGRYALLEREIQGNCDCHTFTGIPYVLDVVTGAITSYPRTTIRRIRWDLARGAVWTTGTAYLDMSRPRVIVDLLERLPDRGRQVADAVVSPDRRWLAALLGSSDQLVLEGDGELVLIDLVTGAATSRGSPLRFMRNPGGSYPEVLSWAPDSSSLLVTSHVRFAEQAGGFTSFSEYFRASVPDLTLSRVPGVGEFQGHGTAQWAPAGGHIVVAGIGILRRDGTLALNAPGLGPTGIWSANGRYTLLAGSTGRAYEILDIATGAQRPIGLSIDPSRPIYIQAISDDGETLYLGDPYGP